MTEQQHPRTTELLAALLALSKFSEIIASVSQEENYQRIAAEYLQRSLQHGVACVLGNSVSESDQENMIQLRTWLTSMATEFGELSDKTKTH